MNWILILILVAFAIYAFYNAFALGMFGIPKSLSTTFYLFEERKSWLRIWFPIMMISVAFLLMPAWLELSANSSFQFLAFLAPSAIIFTGAAPAFKRSELENDFEFRKIFFKRRTDDTIITSDIHTVYL